MGPAGALPTDDEARQHTECRISSGDAESHERGKPSELNEEHARQGLRRETVIE